MKSLVSWNCWRLAALILIKLFPISLSLLWFSLRRSAGRFLERERSISRAIHCALALRGATITQQRARIRTNGRSSIFSGFNSRSTSHETDVTFVNLETTGGNYLLERNLSVAAIFPCTAAERLLFSLLQFSSDEPFRIFYDCCSDPPSSLLSTLHNCTRRYEGSRSALLPG